MDSSDTALHRSGHAIFSYVLPSEHSKSTDETMRHCCHTVHMRLVELTAGHGCLSGVDKTVPHESELPYSEEAA